MRRLELPQAREEVLPAGAGPLDQPLLLDHLEDGQTRGGGQRVGHVRGDVQEPLADAVLLDRRARNGRGERDPASERLRHGHEIGDDALALEAEHRA